MKAAGLTAGGFYPHFKNKDELLIEVLRQRPIDLTDAPDAHHHRPRRK
jgi:AcrR family transcriptional regulator